MNLFIDNLVFNATCVTCFIRICSELIIKKVFNVALINNIFVLYSIALHPNKLCIMYKNVSKSQNAKNREK